MKEWEVDFWQSDAGHARLFANRNFPVAVASDGSFRAYDVVPGTYTLAVHVKASRSANSKLIGQLSDPVVVPEPGDGVAPVVDLGTRALRKAA